MLLDPAAPGRPRRRRSLPRSDVGPAGREAEAGARRPRSRGRHGRTRRRPRRGTRHRARRGPPPVPGGADLVARRRRRPRRPGRRPHRLPPRTSRRRRTSPRRSPAPAAPRSARSCRCCPTTTATLDQTEQAAHDVMTSDYRERYDQLFAVIEENAPSTRTVVRAEDGGRRRGPRRRGGGPGGDPGLRRPGPHQPRRRSEPEVFRNQARLTMQRVDGEWLVDDVVTSPAEQ